MSGPIPVKPADAKTESKGDQKGFPRAAAVAVLTRVLSDSLALDESLASTLEGGEERNAQERGWLREVTAGSLRWKTRLDAAIDANALKKKPTGWLRKALLVSAYQIIVQDSVHAALLVHEAVEQIKKKEGIPPSQFANALLRKLSEQSASWREMPRPATGGPAQASVVDQAMWAGLPEWIYRRLVKDHGAPWALDFGKASLERPSLHLRVSDDAPESLLSRLGPPVAGIPGARTWSGDEGGAIETWPGFREGKFFVQDLSSQYLVHEIMTRVRADFAEPRTLDLCAAPGGKSLGLAWSGAKVVATDSSETRMKLLRENIARAGLGRIEGVAMSEAVTRKDLDLVWIDAPCTGVGIIRRHPDVKWIRQEKDLSALVDVQAELLRQGWEKTRKGGYLAYSVCSPFKAEGSEQIARAGLSDSIEKEWLLAPHLALSGDGFYCALLKKKT